MKFQFENLPLTILIQTFNNLDEFTLTEVTVLNKAVYRTVNKLTLKEILHKKAINQSNYEPKNENERTQISYNKVLGRSTKCIEVCNHEQYVGFIAFSVLNRVPLWNPGNWANTITTNVFPNLIKLKLWFSLFSKHIDICEISNIKNILFQLEAFELRVLTNVDLDKIIMNLNPNKLKVLKISCKYECLKMGNIMKFRQFKQLKELYFEFKFLQVGGSYLPDYEETIFPSLERLSIIGEEYTNIDFKLFGKLPNSAKITLNMAPGKQDNKRFINNANVDNAELNYISHHLNSNHEYINVLKVVDGLKPILKGKKFTTINFYYLRNINYNRIRSKESNKQFSKVQSISFIDCNIRIQTAFEILPYFPNVIKLRFNNCELSNIDYIPLVYLGEVTDFLLISDSKSIKKDGKLQSLLKNINTYIY